MDRARLTVRIDARVKETVEAWCLGRGVSVSRFVEEAVVERLEGIEDHEDGEDLAALRKERTRPLEDVIRELGFEDLLAR